MAKSTRSEWAKEQASERAKWGGKHTHTQRTNPHFIISTETNTLFLISNAIMELGNQLLFQRSVRCFRSIDPFPFRRRRAARRVSAPQLIHGSIHRGAARISCCFWKNNAPELTRLPHHLYLATPPISAPRMPHDSDSLGLDCSRNSSLLSLANCLLWTNQPKTAARWMSRWWGGNEFVWAWVNTCCWDDVAMLDDDNNSSWSLNKSAS